MNPAGQIPPGMMPGMPGMPGQQQAGATTGGQQALAQVMAKMKSQPMPTAGWQTDLPVTDRWKIVNQIATSLRLVQGELDPPRAVKMAEAFESHTFSTANSKEEYIGACRGKMQQIQETRMRKQADTEQHMRDQQFLNRNPQLAQQQQQQQQLLLAQRIGLQANPMAAQQQAQQQAAQQAQQQQQAGMPGMMPANMNIAAAMANPALQAQMAIAAQAQPGLIQQQLGQQQQMNNPLQHYRGLPKDQAIEHLARTMQQQAQPQHLQQIRTQLAAMSDEHKAQCERLNITPVELFFRNAAAKKLLQNQVMTNMPGMPPGPGGAGGMPQLSQQQMTAQQVAARQQQLHVAAQQQRLLAAQSALGKGQQMGQPPQGFDNKMFMNDIQSYLKQPAVTQAEAMGQKPPQGRPGIPTVTMPPGSGPPQGTPQMAASAQQQQMMMLHRQAQAQAQAAQAAQRIGQQQQQPQQSPPQPPGHLVGQHPSPQMNLLNQTHRPGSAASQQAAQAVQAQAVQAQAQINRMAELQRQNQIQQQQQAQAAAQGHPGAMQRPQGNFQIPPGFPIQQFANLPPEKLQALIANFTANKQAQIQAMQAAGQNPGALLQQQQIEAQNRLRAGMGGTSAQQIQAAQNALLHTMNANSSQPPNAQLTPEQMQKLQMQKLANLRNMHLEQNQLAQKLAQSITKPPQPGQPAQGQPGQLQQQQQQLNAAQQQQQQQQQAQAGQQQQQQQAQQRGPPMVPDVPFPPSFDNVKYPQNALAFLKRQWAQLDIPNNLGNWGSLKEWAKQVNPDVAARVRGLHFLHIQELSKKMTGPMLQQYQEFASRLNAIRQAHLQQAQVSAAQQQQQQQQQQQTQAQQSVQMSPPKPPVKQPTPNQAAAPTPKMVQQNIEATGRVTPTQNAQNQQQANARGLKRAAQPEEPQNSQAGNAQNNQQALHQQQQQGQQGQQQQGQGKPGDWQTFLQRLMIMPPDMQQQLLSQPRMAQLPNERKVEIGKVIALSRAKLAQQNAAARLPGQQQVSATGQAQNQAKPEAAAPTRPPTAPGLHQQAQQAQQQQQQQQQQQKPPAAQAAAAPTAAGPQGAGHMSAAQMDPAKQVLKNKEQVQLMRQEEMARALARPPVQMSDEVKAVMRQAIKESSQTLLRMEQWIPMFLMLLPAPRIVRELFQTRAVLATQFEDAQFQTTKENFTITPEELEAAKSQIHRYFNYVKAQVPKLNEQRLKAGQPLIPVSAIPNFQQQQQQQLQLQQPPNIHPPGPSQAAAKAPVPNLNQADITTQALQQKLPVQNIQQQDHKQAPGMSQSMALKEAAAPPAPTAPLPPAAPFNLGQIPPRKKAKQGSESPSFPKTSQPDKVQVQAAQQAVAQQAVAAAAAANQKAGLPGKGTLPPQYSHLCIVKGCEYSTKPFASQAELLRHLKEDHKDSFTTHIRNSSGIPHQERPPPLDPIAMREKQEKMIEMRNKAIINPLEYTLSSVAEALGLNRDGTRKAIPEESKDKDAAVTTSVKAPTPKASTPLNKTPSKTAPTPTGTQSSPAKPDGKEERNAAARILPPGPGWNDNIISPTVIQQAFEGLDDVADLMIDHVTPEMIMTPDDSVPGTPPTLSDIPMTEEEMRDFEAWNPFGIRNTGPRGLVEDIDWELVEDQGTNGARKGWDSSLFGIRS